MFQARIIALRETRESFLSITLNHTVADALSLLSWHQDSNHFISDSENENRPQTQFRFFSDLFDRYQGSAPAREAVLFHVKQLRGISRLKGALWPNKRAPGWMISYDECSSLKDERMQAREDVWNGEWLSKAEVFRFPRVGRVVCLPTLKKLKEQGIEPALFASCAIALFNVQQTGASHAIFNTWESGRSWPFVPDWMSAILPPAMSIDGPTCQWILTITEVVEDETVLGLLHRLASEHEVLKHYEHVPWQQVIEGLRDEGHVAIDASFRQSFVWDVTLGFAAQNRHSDPMSPLQPMARFDWPDWCVALWISRMPASDQPTNLISSGFFWNAFMADTENLFFVASWDTAQMNDKEVELCCDQLTEVMRKLAHESNWDRIVGEVFG
jgi:hypothetical protein